jgi:hypothetical protein
VCARAPSKFPQLYAAFHILWSRVWANGNRYASKDGYAPVLCGGSDMNF